MPSNSLEVRKGTRSRSNSHSSSKSITRDAAVTAAGAVLLADGAMKAVASEHHRKRHVVEAVAGGVIAATAFQHARKSMSDIETETKVKVEHTDYSSESESEDDGACHVRGALPAPEVVVNVHDRDHSADSRHHRHRHEHRVHKHEHDKHEHKEKHAKWEKNEKKQHESTLKHVSHLVEEGIGAYNLAKGALGDNHHPAARMAAAALGAAGLMGEAKAHVKAH